MLVVNVLEYRNHTASETIICERTIVIEINTITECNCFNVGYYLKEFQRASWSQFCFVFQYQELTPGPQAYWVRTPALSYILQALKYYVKKCFRNALADREFWGLGTTNNFKSKSDSEELVCKSEEKLEIPYSV